VSVLSLFFYFSLALLAYTESHASSPTDLLDNATSSSEISLKSAETLRSSFLSTPRAIARPDDFDADSPTDSTPDDEKKTMKGLVSASDLLVPTYEEGGVEYDAELLLSPLNLDRKEAVLAADDVPLNLTFIRKYFKGCNVITAEDGVEVVEKARKAASIGTQIKVAFIDFFMPKQNGNIAATQIRDMDFDGIKPYQNTIFICVSATPGDALPYEIKDMEAWLAGALRGTDQVFHQIIGKIDTPLKAKTTITFVNGLLDRIASYQLGLLDIGVIAAK
jgi:CheY-like chemotaxis protein